MCSIVYIHVCVPRCNRGYTKIITGLHCYQCHDQATSTSDGQQRWQIIGKLSIKFGKFQSSVARRFGVSLSVVSLLHQMHVETGNVI